MQPHLVKYLAALLTGLSLTLAPALPASAQGNDTSSTQAVISEEYVGWFSTLQNCSAVGQDYVRRNGASGYSCRPRAGGYDLWVSYN